MQSIQVKKVVIMPILIKIMFGFIWLFCGVLPFILYAKNFDRVRVRYWGKNRTWLKYNMRYNLFATTIVFIIVLFVK